MSFSLICPYDGKTINAQQVRINAALVCVTALASSVFNLPIMLLVLGYDFYCRGFLNKKISLLNGISKYAVEVLELPYQAENRAPKRFAARIGFIMAIAATLAGFTGFYKTFVSVTSILVLFSFLEAAFSFCAGCIVYTLLTKFKN